MEKEKVRLDKYLWAIRLFKTRALAVEAITKNKVKLNDTPVKASKVVHIGDVYHVRNERKQWVIEVSGILSNRVNFTEAQKYYKDITPAEENAAISYQAAAFHTGKRLSKVGRPTKKQQRDIEDFMNDIQQTD
jgi:ribosome-associated heat shock protein Hsp15